MSKAWAKIGKTTFWLTWPALFGYLYFSTRTRVIVSYKGQVLLVKSWLGSGRWMLPGGGLHPGEDTVLGALREVKEETGIQLNPAQIKFLEKRRVRDGGLSSKLVIYTIDLLTLPSFRPQKLESLDVRWLSVKDIADENDVSQATKQIVATWRQLDQPVKMKAG